MTINGKGYYYLSDKLDADELKAKVLSISKYSVGRALAWLKQNAKANQVKEEEAPVEDEIAGDDMITLVGDDEEAEGEEAEEDDSLDEDETHSH